MTDLPGRSFVKICGVTSVHDADVVTDAGATALGVILTTSRRRVDPAVAREITDHVRGRILSVAVVDTKDEGSLDAWRSGLDVDLIQVHGELSEDLLDELRQAGLMIIKALSLGTSHFNDFDERWVDAVLVDGPVPGSGTAHSFAALVDRPFARPVIAAGGLTPLTVAAVIDAYAVWGVDVASGVESASGVKDPRRVVEFVDAARRAFARRGAA